MKCPYFYRTIGMVSKKGKKFTKTFKEYEKSDANELCDGTIIADVEIDEVPDWGTTHHVLQVTYKCSKCEQEILDARLPYNIDEITELVTNYVEKL